MAVGRRRRRNDEDTGHAHHGDGHGRHRAHSIGSGKAPRKPVAQPRRRVPADDVPEATDAAPPKGQGAMHTFYKSVDDLETALGALPTHQSDMYTAGMEMCCEIRKIASEEKKRVSLLDLTEIAEIATRLVRGNAAHPKGDDGYREDADNFHQRINKVRRFPFAKVLGGVMLGLLGSVIIAASGIVAAASFGLVAPISAFGTVLGASMVVGAASIVTGALGIGANLGAGALFFKAAQKDPLRESMKKFETGVGASYGFKL